MYGCTHLLVRSQNCEKRLLASSCLSVHPWLSLNGTQLPLDGLSRNLIFRYFSKICCENWSFIKVEHEYPALYMQTDIHFLIKSRSVFPRMRNISNKIRRENQYTQFVFHNIFFCFDIMWKNIIEQGSLQMTIWCMCIASWIPKSKNTCSDYVILINFPLQQWSQKHTGILQYMYIACLANWTPNEGQAWASGRICLCPVSTEYKDG